MNVLTCDKVFRELRAMNLHLALLQDFKTMDLSERTVKRLEAARIQFVWQLIARDRVDYYRENSLPPIACIELDVKCLAPAGLEFGTLLSYELKIALGIKLTGKEPREPLPTLDEIKEQINRLTWLRDNYDDVKAGVKAFDWP